MSQTSSLSIRDFQLMVHLGVGEEERGTKQNILIDIELIFRDPPVACHSDEISDTTDYVLLCESLRERLTARSYKTIEKMAKEAFDTLAQVLATRLPEALEIVIKKPQVDIPGLQGGSCFRLRSPL